MDSNFLWKKDPVVLIISCKYIALMEDQVKKLSSLGLQAVYVGGGCLDSSVPRNIQEGNVTYIFMYPESTLGTEGWRSILGSDVRREPYWISCRRGALRDRVESIQQQREEIGISALVRLSDRTAITRPGCIISSSNFFLAF